MDKITKETSDDDISQVTVNNLLISLASDDTPSYRLEHRLIGSVGYCESA